MPLRFGYRLDLRDPTKTLEYAAGAEEAGFDYAWVPDHVTAGAPGQVCFDAWVFLAAAGMKTTRMKLGPSVSDIVRRDPVMLAQSAATAQLITGGRCVLGLGLGEAMNLVPFGRLPMKEVARLREAIEVIRLLWTSSFDRRVSFSGKFYEFKDSWLQVGRAGPAPIYVGGLGPKTQQMAGEIADGWFPAIHTRETFARSVNNIRIGLESAARNVDSFDVVARFYIALTGDVKEGLRRVGPAARNMLLSEQRSLEERGVLTEEMRAFGAHSMVPQVGQWQKAQQEVLARIPDEVVEDATLVGSPEKIAEKISEFRKLGATQVVVQDPTEGVLQTQREFMKSVVPLLS
ncbi:MAG: LLM class flavin-dependent oxidoreductase [Nitrososphaerota archaeon]|nr:LLM class flavin-dependent oxidoreductase [Nitrososphaerota archaeon]